MVKFIHTSDIYKPSYNNTVEGNVVITGDLTVSGNIIQDPTISSNLTKTVESDSKRIDRLEMILGLATRDPVLERKYPELEILGNQMDQAIKKIYEDMNQAISNFEQNYSEFANECRTMEKLKTDL